MNYEDLTPEQKERARACKSPEDILRLAQAEGYELTDEELSSVAGGGFWDCDDLWCTSYVGDQLDSDPGWN